MGTMALWKGLACPKDNKPRAIKAVIRQEKLGFLEETASEALEEEHRKLAQTETDEFQREIHRQLAEAQAQMRREGVVKLQLQCPDHSSGGEYSFLMEDLPQNAPIIKEHLLRCLKCGQAVTPERTNISGNFNILHIRCSTHGTGQRKISTSLHDTIMQAPPKQQPTPTLPPTPTAKITQTSKPEMPTAEDVEIKFCWNCGAKVISSVSQYCYKCGIGLKPP
jgi:hypothetical protein